MIQSLLRMKQMAGVEPVYSAWEADILPMNYICKVAVVLQRLLL